MATRPKQNRGRRFWARQWSNAPRAGRSPTAQKMAPSDVVDDDDKPLTEMLRSAADGVNHNSGALTIAKESDGFAIVSGTQGGGARGTKRRAGKSGFRGVALHNKSGRYRARITSTAGDGRQRALGYFSTAEEAAKAWDAAARQIGFAPELLNFPDEGEEKAAEAAIEAWVNEKTTKRVKPGEGHAAIARIMGSMADDAPEAIPGAPVDKALALIVDKPTEESGKGGEDQLALATKGESETKARKMKGVRPKGHQQYEARIKMRGEDKRTCLGRFKTPEEAADAYDQKAREAGYCVNVCKRVGDHVDTKTLDEIGVATNTKGVRIISAAHASTLDRGVISEELRPAFDREANLDSKSSAQAAAAAAGGELFGAFLLDKPGIHKFLGVFTMEAHCVVALKNTLPEWKIKNQERERNGKGAKARKKQGTEQPQSLSFMGTLVMHAEAENQAAKAAEQEAATQAEAAAVAASLPGAAPPNGGMDTTGWLGPQ